MKKENNLLRKAINDTSKEYVEVVNENLELRRRLEKATEHLWRNYDQA